MSMRTRRRYGSAAAHGTGAGRRQRGIVLVVVLIILAILSMLSLTTLSTTGMEEKMAFSAQEYNRAFQAAESGISEAMKLTTALSSAATQAVPVTNNFSFQAGVDAALTQNWYEAMGREAPPGYSMGGPFRAHYFQMTSTATTTGGGSAVHHQGYYVVGPGT